MAHDAWARRAPLVVQDFLRQQRHDDSEEEEMGNELTLRFQAALARPDKIARYRVSVNDKGEWALYGENIEATHTESPNNLLQIASHLGLDMKSCKNKQNKRQYINFPRLVQLTGITFQHTNADTETFYMEYRDEANTIDMFSPAYDNIRHSLHVGPRRIHNDAQHLSNDRRHFREHILQEPMLVSAFPAFLLPGMESCANLPALSMPTFADLRARELGMKRR